jgi:hypothetical protein
LTKNEVNNESTNEKGEMLEVREVKRERKGLKRERNWVRRDKRRAENEAHTSVK